MQLKDYKKLFVQGKHIHLNNGGLSPISKPVHDEINYWSKRFYEDGFHSDFDYQQRVAWSRLQVSELVDCQPDEIAFFQSCAWAINQFAFGIGLKENDEVLMYDQEYSSNLYPWQAACKKSGAQLVILKSGPKLEMSIEEINSKINSKTKVISISSVQYQTGSVIDLKDLSDLCQEKKILLFVDATQSLGIHQLSFKNLKIDGLASGSHKWLNAPVGLGFLIVRKELALEMKPLAFGAYTYGDCDDPSDFECKPKLSALKFEAGAKQVLEINGLGKAIDLINGVGTNHLKTEAFHYAEVLKVEILKLGYQLNTSIEAKNSSQFVNFSGKKSNQEIQKYFFSNNIHLPIRGPGIRVTPHAINFMNDIDQFVELLKKF